MCSDLGTGNATDCYKNICQAYNATNSAIPLSHLAKDVLTYMYVSVTAVMSLLSVAGSVTIIFYYYRLPELRNKSRQLLVYLSACDLVIALGNIIGIIWIKVFRSEHPDTYKTVHTKKSGWDWTSDDHIWICKIQAILCTGFSIASFLWTSIIAINVFLTVVYNNRQLSLRYQWLLHTISWGITVAIVTTVLVNDRFGYNPCLDLTWWCWIQPLPSDSNTNYIIGWQLLGGKIWEIASYILVFVLYMMVKIKLNKHVSKMESNLRAYDSASAIPQALRESAAYVNANKKLTYIPLVFIIARIWGTLRFLLGISNPYTAVLSSYIAPFQALGDSAQGFFNCLVFISTTPVLKEKFTRKNRKKPLSQLKPTLPEATFYPSFSEENNSLYPGSRSRVMT